MDIMSPHTIRTVYLLAFMLISGMVYDSESKGIFKLQKQVINILNCRETRFLQEALKRSE